MKRWGSRFGKGKFNKFQLGNHFCNFIANGFVQTVVVINMQETSCTWCRRHLGDFQICKCDITMFYQVQSYEGE